MVVYQHLTVQWPWIFELCFVALHLWQSSLSVLTLGTDVLRCADKPVHLHESSIKSWLPEAYFLRAAEGAAAPVQPSPPLVLITR